MGIGRRRMKSLMLTITSVGKRQLKLKAVLRSLKLVDSLTRVSCSHMKFAAIENKEASRSSHVVKRLVRPNGRAGGSTSGALKSGKTLSSSRLMDIRRSLSKKL